MDCWICHRDLFQSLIGRLQTFWVDGVKLYLPEFQSLIGRLQTREEEVKGTLDQ